jgi:hypothetical protein
MSSAYDRFMASTEIDYERWHEGIGYDLDALGAMDPDERFRTEHWLLVRAGQDWRDLEALLALGSDAARAAVVEQLRAGKLEQRLQAARLLRDDPTLTGEIEAAAVAGLESALLYDGLSIALDLATTHRTPALIDALFRAALRDEGEAAVHAAARLAFIHGVAKEEFDWELRPLFLRFNTQDRAEREVAFRELCALCKVDPEPYLRAPTDGGASGHRNGHLSD